MLWWSIPCAPPSKLGEAENVSGGAHPPSDLTYRNVYKTLTDWKKQCVNAGLSWPLNFSPEGIWILLECKLLNIFGNLVLDLGCPSTTSLWYSDRVTVLVQKIIYLHAISRNLEGITCRSCSSGRICGEGRAQVPPVWPCLPGSILAVKCAQGRALLLSWSVVVTPDCPHLPRIG